MKISQEFDYELFNQLMDQNENELNNKWKKAKQDNFHTVYTQMIPNFPVIICKVHTVLQQCDAKLIAKMICDTDIRKKWDKVMKTLEVIQKIDDFTDIIYSELQTPVLFQNRDYVQIRVQFNNKDDQEFMEKYKIKQSSNFTQYICMNSIQLDTVPNKKNLVRAESPITAFRLEQIDDNVKFTMILQTNIKGYVPLALFNQIAQELPGTWIKQLYAYYKKNT